MTGRETVSRRTAGVPPACYDTLLATSTDPSLVLTAHGECLDANQAACSLLGYDHDEVPTLRLTDLLAAGAAQAEPADAAFLAAGTWAGALDLRRKDGAVLHVEARATLVQPGVYLATVRDPAASQVPAPPREDVLTLVSHELNTPLTILLGRAQLLRRRGAVTEADLEAIIDHAAHLGHLIKDLHLASSLEAGQLQPRRTETDLAALARSVVSRVQSTTPTHTLRSDGPDAGVIGSWDKECVQQVIQNLLANAIKYSPAGSTVVVRVEDLGASARVWWRIRASVSRRMSSH
jgi:PAS domain S-box-containing protein